MDQDLAEELIINREDARTKSRWTARKLRAELLVLTNCLLYNYRVIIGPADEEFLMQVIDCANRMTNRLITKKRITLGHIQNMRIARERIYNIYKRIDVMPPAAPLL